MIIRSIAVLVGVAGWYLTQYLIREKKQLPADSLEEARSLLTCHDRVLQFLAPVNGFLNTHPRWTNALLIVSSGLIDALGIFLLASSIWGPSFRPFLGLLILFGLRQVCQALVTLPPPTGMIWRYPGLPSLFVTYGVSNDLFFSGHTALVVYGAAELARLGTGWLAAAIVLGAFEVALVLALRAHYTLDVFAGLVTALLVAWLANELAPWCDRILGGS
jgi:PAP2 superfamily C-terminal